MCCIKISWGGVWQLGRRSLKRLGADAMTKIRLSDTGIQVY